MDTTDTSTSATREETLPTTVDSDGYTSASDSDDYSNSDYSSSSDDSAAYSSDDESEEEEELGEEDLEQLLADRADELAIARSLGASYRALEIAAETKIKSSRAINATVTRIKKRIDVAAVKRRARRVRSYVKSFVRASAHKLSGEGSVLTGAEGSQYKVTTDAQGRRKVTKIEDLEKELNELKSLMAAMAKQHAQAQAEAKQQVQELRAEQMQQHQTGRSRADAGTRPHSAAQPQPKPQQHHRRQSRDLLSAIVKGKTLKTVEGGRSPGGTPALLNTKRKDSKSGMSGAARLLSMALDNKFKNTSIRMDDSSSDDTGDSDCFESSDDEGSPAPRVVRVRRVQRRASQPTPHGHSKLSQCQWGMGQSVSASATASSAPLSRPPPRGAAPRPRGARPRPRGYVPPPRPRRNTMPSMRPPALPARGGPRGRSSSNAPRAAAAPGVSAAPRPSFLAEIAGFSKSKLGKTPRKSNQRKRGGSAPAAPGPMSLLDSIKSFRRNSLKSVDTASSAASGTTATEDGRSSASNGKDKPVTHANALQAAILNRRLRKTPKGNQQTAKATREYTSSPSFLNVKLRKTRGVRRGAENTDENTKP